MLAQAFPQDIGGWLQCLFWLGGGVLCVLKIVSHFSRPDPTPANSTLDARVDVVQRDVVRLDSDLKRVDADVRALGKQISENGEVRKQAMLHHIDQVRKELKGDIHELSNRMDAKLQTVSDNQTRQLIAALKGKND